MMKLVRTPLLAVVALAWWPLAACTDGATADCSDAQCVTPPPPPLDAAGDASDAGVAAE